MDMKQRKEIRFKVLRDKVSKREVFEGSGHALGDAGEGSPI
jgi:hypothetical protein